MRFYEMYFVRNDEIKMLNQSHKYCENKLVMMNWAICAFAYLNIQKN